MTFKPGDIVKLKSGGPPLTVWGTNNDICEVCWFVGGEVRRDTFAEVEIEAWKMTYEDPSAVFTRLCKHISEKAHQ